MARRSLWQRWASFARLHSASELRMARHLRQRFTRRTPCTRPANCQRPRHPEGQRENGVRNGVGRLELPPGEYTLQADASSGAQNAKDRIVLDFRGTARVRLTAGARASVTLVVGETATASGRVFFDGDSSPPPAAAGGRLPMFASDGQFCRRISDRRTRLELQHRRPLRHNADLVYSHPWRNAGFSNP